MSQFSIQTRESIPEHVATLLDIGLETRDESDRLLALQAANHFDRQAGLASGAVVVEACVRQMGLELIGFDWLFESEAWYIQSVTERESILVKEVARAVGATLGVSTSLFELVDSETETGVVTALGLNKPGDVTDLDTVIDRLPDMQLEAFMDLDKDRPYGVIQRFWNSHAQTNFQLALSGIHGGTEAA